MTFKYWHELTDTEKAFEKLSDGDAWVMYQAELNDIIHDLEIGAITQQIADEMIEDLNAGKSDYDLTQSFPYIIEGAYDVQL